MADNKYQLVNGKANVNTGATTAVLIAAPGVGKKIRITWGVLAITFAATGGSGLVSLKDGSTVIISFPANTADVYYWELGDDGFPLSDNGALNLVVESAGTLNATVFAAMSGFVVG